MLDQLHLEQQADIFQIEQDSQAKIREDIMKACLLGSDYVHALTDNHIEKANQIMHQVTQIINQYT